MKKCLINRFCKLGKNFVKSLIESRIRNNQQIETISKVVEKIFPVVDKSLKLNTNISLY